MYEKNQIVTDKFTISSIKERKNYLELKLKKDETSFSAILKDNIDLFLRTYNNNDEIVSTFKVRKRKDDILLELISIKKTDNITASSKKIENQKDEEIYKERLNEIIPLVKDKHYKELLDNFFTDEYILESFCFSPASREFHHNYQGGLLQHTIEVCEILLSYCSYYKDLNKELLLTAGLLHDIGKIRTYEFRNGIFHSEWGELLGHISISAIFISKMMPDDMPTDKAMVLYHLILSHHGKLEYGSPVEGKMREAEILHDADLTSCKMNHIENLDYSATNWSKIDNKTKKSWFKGNV